MFQLVYFYRLRLLSPSFVYMVYYTRKRGEKQVEKTRWCSYSTAYHFVWCPKYRRKVLTGDVARAMKVLVAECCERNGMKLLAVEADLDHIHVFVSAPPRMSPAGIVKLLKGYTSKALREKFPKLKEMCGDDALWTRTYYVGTAGNVSREIILRYIEECQGR